MDGGMLPPVIFSSSSEFPVSCLAGRLPSLVSAAGSRAGRTCQIPLIELRLEVSGLSSFHQGRSTELRLVDRDIRLHFLQLNGIPPIQPRKGPAKGYLNSTNVAIVAIIDLCR